MAGLGKITESDTSRREDAARVGVAVCSALALHFLLFHLMMFKTPAPFEVKEDFIAIELVTLPPAAQIVEVPRDEPPEDSDAPLPPQPPKLKPMPVTPPPAPSVQTVTPNILTSEQLATANDAGNTVPPSIADAASPNTNQRSADEARIDEGLKALAAELSCLKGFSEECAETRKDVFDEFQLTETDKVYTKKYAHTGMPAEFYGMSERAIREKLNLKFAGENGLVIIPFLLTIDGDIWDAMHGVNKKCEWKVSASGARHGAIKDCPDYLPAAKEDRDRRNKFQARLKANEARRNAEKDSK
jgi:hypothetical protein